MKRIFKFLLSLLVIYTLWAFACFGVTFIDSDPVNDGEFDYYKPARILHDTFGGLPQKTNFVIFGTDAGGTRTDTVIAGCYNKTDKTLDLVSIPRDTIVTVDDKTFRMMNEEYPEPGSNTMKLNSVYHFCGNEYGIGPAVSEVEKIIGADIDYSCVVDFEALRFIVDELGGVDFYVPCNMYYNDPYQDLYIELYEGQQTLNGDEAEQLLRYRSGYLNADLGRVEVQQDFLKEFISQALSLENITSNFKDYIKAFSEYVQTDISVSKAVRYAAEVRKLEKADIYTCTLPGDTDYVDGVSGFVPDYSDGTIEDIFN